MELDTFLHEAVITLGAAVLVVLVCSRLRIPSLIGLLLTGILIGPSLTGLVADLETIHVFAEIGVVFLLFTIGLELSLARLAEARRPFLIGGSLQAALTIAIAFALASAIGWQPASALFFGFVLTLSSTAIVLKLHGERGESHSPHGKVSLAILLFQDFLIVPMIVLTPVLGGEVPASPRQLAIRFGGALLAIALMFWIARKAMPRFLDQLDRSGIRELFVLGALGICLAMSWLTHSLGFSLALGAFVAGILVSETDYSHQVFADVAPFRDVFASVFFVSIGMLVDLRVLVANAAMVLGLAAAIIVVKAIVVAIAVAALRFPARTVASAALGLAQIGEFSFVLMEVGRGHGLLGGERYQLLLSAAVVTMLATPLLLRLGPAAGEAWLRLRRLPSDAAPPDGAEPGKADHVVVVGFGTSGTLLVKVLREVSIPYCVIELDGEIVRRAQTAGEPVIYGDATRREILEHAGIGRANAAVLAFSDRPALERCVALARDLNPSLEILVRVREVQEIEPLQQRGADQVVADEFETAIEIFTRVLERFHVPRNVIRAQTRLLRGEGYLMLRSETLRDGVTEAVLEALAAGTTEVFRVDPASAVAGRTLRDVDLRRRCGASVIAVVRGDRSYANPSPELVLEPGDDLVLMGSHAEVDRAFALLGSSVDSPARSR